MDLTNKQAAERLHVSHEKIRQMILEGLFPHAFKKDGSKKTSPYVIPERDLIAFERKWRRSYAKSKKRSSRR